ncbi:MAG: four helix bundle protein [Candidatus Neomarinimicrobiota bacterium]
MNFDDWVGTVPSEITDDALWGVKAYRISLFASELGWNDVTKLTKDRRTLNLSNQLYRSLGSVSANIAEGYSRGSKKDQTRFYEYSLGSARESRDWYYKGRHVLGTEIAIHRIRFLTQIIRLLLTTIPQKRSYRVSEPNIECETGIEELLTNIPIP